MNRRSLLKILPAGAIATALMPRSAHAQTATSEFVNVKTFGATGDGVTDDTAAIQTAVNASGGCILVFPKGNYKISAPIKILTSITLFCARGSAQIVLSTTNMDGFVIGDGTANGAAASANTVIDGFNFVPGANTTNFSTGSCIFVNYAYYIFIQNCDFYGKDASLTSKLFNAITIFQVTTFYVQRCWFNYFLGTGIRLSGTITPDHALRTVDGYLDELEFTGIAAHCVDLLSGTAGIVMNRITGQEYSKFGIHVATNPVGGDGQNIFIVQPDLEADGSSGGIWLEYAQRVQIIGGWIGVSDPASAAIHFDSHADSCTAQGVAVAFGSVIFDGPANSLSDCEVSGDAVNFVDAITVNSGAFDTSISNCRVRQVIGAGIRFTGNPQRCLVSDCHFRQVGTEIVGQSFSPQSLPPQITGGQTDQSFSRTSAASMVLNIGRPMYQFVGNVPISQLTNLGQGQRVTIQAGAGGNTYVSGGNIQLKTSPRSVPAFSTISFINDGQTWFEDGSNF